MEEENSNELLKITLESLNLKLDDIVKFNIEESERIYQYIIELQKNGKIIPILSVGDLVDFDEKHNTR